MFLETFLLEHFSYTVLFQVLGKHVIENLFLLFELRVREHVSTQDTLAHENVSTQGTLAGEHVRHAI